MSEAAKKADMQATQVMAGVLSESLSKLSLASDGQMTAILGLAGIVACLPETRAIPAERLGAVINLLSQGRPDAEMHRKHLAQYIGMVTTLSARMAEAEGKAAGAAPETAPKNAPKH